MLKSVLELLNKNEKWQEISKIYNIFFIFYHFSFLFNNSKTDLSIKYPNLNYLN
jgi:hypothetical protein